MPSTRHKIGTLISEIDERNNLGIRVFHGLNICKEFMPTAASTDALDEKKYKVVRHNRFVFSGMQTGRDEVIRISTHQGEEPIIVSPAYITFEVTATDIVLPQYFFMRFLSKEMDRYGWFVSDSSVRSNLGWSVFCDIELDLPPLEVQQRYVDIYRAMVENQQTYERGLEDLKLTYEAELDRLKRESVYVEVGDLLREIDVRNVDGAILQPKGINIRKRFIPTVATISSDSVANYKVVYKRQFAYSAMQTGRDETIRIALLRDDEPVAVSPAYSVLEVKDSSAVLPEYIMMWFSRPESDRYGWFASDGSVRASLELERFLEIKIPVPKPELQFAIASLYDSFITRTHVADRMAELIRDVCPVLIRGSLDETNYEYVAA